MLFQKIYTINDNYFENIDTPRKAYWLGMIYADGSIKKIKDELEETLAEGSRRLTFGLNIDDEYMVKNLIDDLGSDHYVHHYKTLAYFNISSVKMFNDLVNHGIVPNKSYVYTFPLNVPNNLITHYVRGVFDGDGCVTGKEKQMQVQITGNKPFCDWICKVIGKGHVTKYSDKKTVFRWRMGGWKQVKWFYEYLYKDADMFLERKYDVFNTASFIDSPDIISNNFNFKTKEKVYA